MPRGGKHVFAHRANDLYAAANEFQKELIGPEGSASEEEQPPENIDDFCAYLKVAHRKFFIIPPFCQNVVET